MNKVQTTKWATIGGRIEDYAKIVTKSESSIKGLRKASKQINKDYGPNNGLLVFRGLLVYLEHGVDVYYGGFVT